ncbi:hypothetical protein CMI37_16255 [Candidatus Pacearchaeota archaeon]|nr:hypothetical protein [Candidatus Pacearchaeota archaeon]
MICDVRDESVVDMDLGFSEEEIGGIEMWRKVKEVAKLVDDKKEDSYDACVMVCERHGDAGSEKVMELLGEYEESILPE